MKLFLASGGIGALPSMFDDPVGKRIAVISNAAEVMDNPFWVDDDIKNLTAMGFDLTNIDLKLENVGSLRLKFEVLDGIFVCGSNTFYLLQVMQQCEFPRVLPELLNRGGVYAGVSAGAIVAGPDISVTAEPNQRDAVPELSSTLGFALVDFHVLPHAGRDDERFTAHHSWVLQMYPRKLIIRITDNEAIVVNDDQITIVPSPLAT